MRKRTLSEEEKRLWKAETRGAKRLRAAAADEKDEGGERDKKPGARLRIKAHLPMAKTAAPLVAGMDRHTAKRFDEIDATLDLHGKTLASAHTLLVAFIEKQYARQSRTLLVITGKGSGILRESLPGWLDAPTLRGAIVSFSPAAQKHGGTGAYYILLKRKRSTHGA